MSLRAWSHPMVRARRLFSPQVWARGAHSVLQSVFPSLAVCFSAQSAGFGAVLANHQEPPVLHHTTPHHTTPHHTKPHHTQKSGCGSAGLSAPAAGWSSVRLVPVGARKPVQNRMCLTRAEWSNMHAYKHAVRVSVCVCVCVCGAGRCRTQPRHRSSAASGWAEPRCPTSEQVRNHYASSSHRHAKPNGLV